MNALKIKKFGNSAGVILSKELLAQLGTDVGDSLSVTRTPRGIELARAQPDFDAQMAAMRQAMSQYKEALRYLAGHEVALPEEEIRQAREDLDRFLAEHRNSQRQNGSPNA